MKWTLDSLKILATKKWKDLKEEEKTVVRTFNDIAGLSQNFTDFKKGINTMPSAKLESVVKKLNHPSSPAVTTGSETPAEKAPAAAEPGHPATPKKETLVKEELPATPKKETLVKEELPATPKKETLVKEELPATPKKETLVKEELPATRDEPLETPTHKHVPTSNRTLWILGGFVLLLVVIFVILVSRGGKETTSGNGKIGTVALTLIGHDTTLTAVGSTWLDPGAKVSIDGKFYKVVFFNGTVNTSRPDTTTVDYSYSRSDVMKRVSRVVVVYDPAATPPTKTSGGFSELDELLNEAEKDLKEMDKSMDEAEKDLKEMQQK